ncbi:MAG: DUF2249 domain-containing protein [Burkholderiaceae bacterium]|nr:DUF2249 domain-containing protein [Burkholderiaceae bacterium]
MSAATTNALDIREIAPRERHAVIFARFDELEPGDALQLINDHDPQPLHGQFQIRSANGFSWDYLEAGPDVWRVQIGKKAKASSNCCSGGACCG